MTIEQIAEIMYEYDMREAYRAQRVIGVVSGKGRAGYESKYFSKKELLRENEPQMAKVALGKIHTILIDAGLVELL